MPDNTHSTNGKPKQPAADPPDQVIFSFFCLIYDCPMHKNVYIFSKFPGPLVSIPR
jgi:hypothetical protein